VNDDALDLGEMLLRERPDLAGLLPREHGGFGLQRRGGFGIRE
jgi:hypothetical protein